MGLGWGASLHYRPNGSGAFLWTDVSDRSGCPARHELLLNNPVCLFCLGQFRGMACQELLCDLGKGSALAALARSPFAGLLNLGVDASLDQRQPLPGLLTCLLKGLLAGTRPADAGSGSWD